MRYFWNGGFYDDEIHLVIPQGAFELTEERYQALMDGQLQGLEIVHGEDGRPMLREPLPMQPQSCTPAQGLVALFALKSITEDNVLAAIGQIPDPVQQYTARIGYQRATTWERNSPTMQAMAQLLQLSDEDLDTLFSYAAGVQV